MAAIDAMKHGDLISELFMVGPQATLADVMESLNNSSARVTFVVDGPSVLGSISDGDLRRALLSGGSLETLAVTVMCEEFVHARPADSTVEIASKFSLGVDVLPVISDSGQLVRFITKRDSLARVPLVAPDVGAYEKNLVIECLDSGWFSSVGRFVTEFELEFERATGLCEAVSTSNGTTALELALRSLGVGAGDQVIIPNLTFGATANAVLTVGAEPVLVDVSQESWCLDVHAVEDAATSRTKAVLPVHLYGFPAPVASLREWCDDKGLFLIEDCAEALGTIHHEKHVGSFGHAATFSFFANKTITTGEGGMVCFEDRRIADRARQIRGHGLSRSRRYWHDTHGTNMRLTSVQAAIGLGQLQRLQDILDRKHALADLYARYLTNTFGSLVRLPPTPKRGKHSHWLYTIQLPDHIDPEATSSRLLSNGVESRRVFNPLHIQPAFSSRCVIKGNYEVSRHISETGLSLPSSPKIQEAEIEFVVAQLAESLRERK